MPRRSLLAIPERMALEVGYQETAQTLRNWAAQRFRVLLPWTAGALAVALLMFGGAWAVATYVPQADRTYVPLFTEGHAGLNDMLWVLWRNSMVLLLHVLVCVAAYLARRAVPLHAEKAKGIDRWVHAHAGPVAMAVVAGLTSYSLCWQTWQLGCDLHSAAHTLGLSPAGLLLRAAVHGIPELTAVFLPLSACLMLGRQKQWNQLAAAALLTTVVAFPVLVVAAALEAWVTGGLF